jgi:hypothetical protein
MTPELSCSCGSKTAPTNSAHWPFGSLWPFEQWGGFLTEQSTSVSILDRLLHPATVVMTDGDFSRM